MLPTFNTADISETDASVLLLAVLHMQVIVMGIQQETHQERDTLERLSHLRDILDPFSNGFNADKIASFKKYVDEKLSNPEVVTTW